MTDNEIVGEMIAWHKVALGQNPDENYVPWHEKNLNAWLAIEDVLALHKGIKSDEDDDFFSHCTCDEWDEYNNCYPCPTRQAITNRIGGSDGNV